MLWYLIQNAQVPSGPHLWDAPTLSAALLALGDNVSLPDNEPAAALHLATTDLLPRVQVPTVIPDEQTTESTAQTIEAERVVDTLTLRNKTQQELQDQYVSESLASNAPDISPYGVHHTLGTGANQACAGNDARLSNARTPTAHSHAIEDLTLTLGGTTYLLSLIDDNGTVALQINPVEAT